MAATKVLKARRSGGGSTAPQQSAIGDVQLGMSGLKRSYGYIYEELLPQLQGRKAVNVYQEMSQNSAVIGATLFAIDMFMRKVAWRVEAATQDDKHQKDAEFLAQCKDDMQHSWPDFISEVNSMLTFGWSWFEICYKRRLSKVDEFGNAQSKYNDGMTGWKKFMPCSQESWWRWDFDPETGDTVGMWQRPAPDYSERYLPWGKSLLFRTTSKKNSPEGQSVLRTAYRAWYFLKRIEEIEAIGVERDLAGIPIAEIPAEMLGKYASPDDKAMVAAVTQLVQSVRRDQMEGIVWPQAYDQSGNKLYDFRLLTSGGTRQFPTDTIISRYESRIAMTVLADFILLGNESGNGSYALSTSKTGMFQSALETWLDSIENVLNEQAVPRLFRMNGKPEGPYPKFRHEIVQKPTLPDLATFISAMAGAGAQLFPDTGLENHLREVAKLPIREENESNEAVEEKIIRQQLDTQLASSSAQEELAVRTGKDAQAEGVTPMPQGSVVQRMDPVVFKPPAGAAGGQGGAQQTAPGGKSPKSKPGAPTKSTGPVKSKLPPASRRTTIGTRAAQGAAPKSNTKPTSVAKGVKKLKPSARAQVRKQLAPDFPEKATSWIDDVPWIGPVRVPIEDLNFSNKKRWAAHHEPGKVDRFRKDIRAGKMKPIVAYDYGAEGPGKIEIADGHHHGLAYGEEGVDPIVYIARVPSKKGPWAEMHSSQRTSSDPDSGDYEPGDRGGAVKKSATLSKKLVDYRPAKDPERRCGTCSMFSISGDDEHGSCSLVMGAIDPNDVCNRWTSLQRVAKGLVGAGGIAVKAADTGRVLMLQRGLDHNDPASGKWEFPGGRRDWGESPETAGVREWQEETGLVIPHGKVTGNWTSSDNIYHGVVLTVPSEADVPITSARRQVGNPDGHGKEVLAWWHPEDIEKNPALRKQLRRDLPDVLKAISSSALRKSVRCEFCQEPATQYVVAKGGSLKYKVCKGHVPAAKAEARWQAETQVSPANASPYSPFPRVIVE